MDSKFYEPEVLKQLQGEILSILDDFSRICEDYHLEYFGIAGATGIWFSMQSDIPIIR